MFCTFVCIWFIPIKPDTNEPWNYITWIDSFIIKPNLIDRARCDPDRVTNVCENGNDVLDEIPVCQQHSFINRWMFNWSFIDVLQQEKQYVNIACGRVIVFLLILLFRLFIDFFVMFLPSEIRLWFWIRNYKIFLSNRIWQPVLLLTNITL